MRKLALFCSLLLIAINVAVANEEEAPSQARVGFHTDRLLITATFATEEMPEYLEGNGVVSSYVVYKLACPSKTAYQLTHLSSDSSQLEKQKKLYIQNFMKSAESMELNSEPITYPLLEEPTKGYYSYVTRGTLTDGLTIALYTDFYDADGHLFVVAQLKLYEQENKQNLEEAKDREFFQSVILESTIPN